MSDFEFLDEHFERIRKRLVSEGNTAKSLKHGLSQGLIREAFIREVLEQSISPLWRVGTGEIMHKGMRASEQRNQIDVIIHNTRYPILSLSKGIDLFFIESVSSFIEVKSSLKKEDVRKFASVTKRIKSQVTMASQRSNPTGMVKTPRPYSFMFCYDGPKKVETIAKWMQEISNEDDYKLKPLRSQDPNGRGFYPHLFIDGIIVLNTGYVCVDALPVLSPLVQCPGVSREYIWISGKKKELFFLWVLISVLNERLLWNEWDVTDYLKYIRFRWTFSR